MAFGVRPWTGQILGAEHFFVWTMGSTLGTVKIGTAFVP